MTDLAVAILWVAGSALGAFLCVRAARQEGNAAPPADISDPDLGGIDSHALATWSFIVTCRPSQWRAARDLGAGLLLLFSCALAVWLMVGPACREGRLTGLITVLGPSGVYMLVMARGAKRYRVEVTGDQARAVPLWGRARQFNVWEIEHLKAHQPRRGIHSFVAFGTGHRRLFWAQSAGVGSRELAAWICHWRPDLAWPEQVLKDFRRPATGPYYQGRHKRTAPSAVGETEQASRRGRAR
ncbi:MAG: hypothetical protein LBC97_05190 [Bifidobacteriaceae bacterium]|nr:hypothetical protein [Bifidobacteriaceae bacterium]